MFDSSWFNPQLASPHSLHSSRVYLQSQLNSRLSSLVFSEFAAEGKNYEIPNSNFSVVTSKGPRDVSVNSGFKENRDLITRIKSTVIESNFKLWPLLKSYVSENRPRCASNKTFALVSFLHSTTSQVSFIQPNSTIYKFASNDFTSCAAQDTVYYLLLDAELFLL